MIHVLSNSVFSFDSGLAFVHHSVLISQSDINTGILQRSRTAPAYEKQDGRKW